MKRAHLAALATALLATTSTFAQDKPLRIGVLNDQSGLYSEFGGIGSVEAARMAVTDFGSSVLGRKIEILSADHQNKTDNGSAIARKWFDADGVDAIADLTNSAIAISVQNLARERGKITLASGPGTARLSNEDCSPTGFHWTWDTYSQAAGTAKAVIRNGGNSWFLLAADYAFGHQMSEELGKLITSNGGRIEGRARHPVSAADFSSFLLQAQSSKAQIIGLANGGVDTTNSVKQANEFGITDAGQRLAAMAVMISDVHALGLPAAKGLLATTGYYWDRNDESRAFGHRYMKVMGRMPDMIQVGVYSSTLHYLKAVKAAGTTDGKVVADKMREMPVNDVLAHGGQVRPDGRMAYDMYLVQVKRPEESKGPWDYYKVIGTVRPNEARPDLSESRCPSIKK